MEHFLKTGIVTKLVSSFGSTWGRIKPTDDERQLFFNHDSLEPGGFESLHLLDEVEFEEERDLANGTRAVRIQRRQGIATASGLPGSAGT